MLALLARLAVRAPPAGPAVAVAEARNPAGSALLARLTAQGRMAIASKGAVEAAPRPIDAAARRGALPWAADETPLAGEAAGLEIAEVTRERAAEELARFPARFPTRAGLARFPAAELTDGELWAVPIQMLRVGADLEPRAGRRSLLADGEVDDYLRDHRLSAESRGAREAVRARMREERVEAAVRVLAADRCSWAEARILDPEPARPGAGEGGP